MKKQVFILVLTFVLLMFTGCGDGRLPDGIAAEKVEQKAHQILDLMNQRDYKILSQQVSNGLAPEEEWRQSLDPLLDGFGEFQEYGKTKFVTNTDKDGTIHFSALVETKYQNVKGRFSVNFSIDQEVVGLFYLG